jgi:hypothetical protein
LRHPSGAPGGAHRAGRRLPAGRCPRRGPRIAPASAVRAVWRAAGLPLDPPPHSPLPLTVGAAPGATTTTRFRGAPGCLLPGRMLPLRPRPPPRVRQSADVIGARPHATAPFARQSRPAIPQVSRTRTFTLIVRAPAARAS